MTSYRYRVKDIKPGDTVQYKPVGQPMTDEFIRTQLLTMGTVIDAEIRIGSMVVTVDWGGWDVPSVVDVNDVELVRRPRWQVDGRPGWRRRCTPGFRPCGTGCAAFHIADAGGRPK